MAPRSTTHGPYTSATSRPACTAGSVRVQSSTRTRESAWNTKRPRSAVSSVNGPAITSLCSECSLRMFAMCASCNFSPSSLLSCGALAGRFNSTKKYCRPLRSAGTWATEKPANVSEAIRTRNRANRCMAAIRINQLYRESESLMRGSVPATERRAAAASLASARKLWQPMSPPLLPRNADLRHICGPRLSAPPQPHHQPGHERHPSDPDVDNVRRHPERRLHAMPEPARLCNGCRGQSNRVLPVQTLQLGQESLSNAALQVVHADEFGENGWRQSGLSKTHPNSTGQTSHPSARFPCWPCCPRPCSARRARRPTPALPRACD